MILESNNLSSFAELMNKSKVWECMEQKVLTIFPDFVTDAVEENDEVDAPPTSTIEVAQKDAQIAHLYAIIQEASDRLHTAYYHSGKRCR